MSMGMKTKPQRDITLGALWFTISLYFTFPLMSLLMQPLAGFVGFLQCILLFLGSKFFLDKTKKCWFPTKENSPDDSRKNP